ncbi:hypothetical protein CJD36_012815 [Flavipsychrobacter stenotrophus]|uniref:Uncharacterized protein n=1 Tax=Flavipsychrobacter stenotrophus TaxID=2077091 RepID=A0A2S7SWE7_9BACT|nr:hypothetical protein [Flavipsychrobacter stenotrophus]PQJ10846.1 hypothetical protein CJD36_012815 [Flavipsychrobacter stenotrophus]
MENTKSNSGKKKGITSFFSHLRATIISWFKPEEVEVTFEEDGGGHMTGYTYTVVQHKNVA